MASETPRCPLAPSATKRKVMARHASWRLPVVLCSMISVKSAMTSSTCEHGAPVVRTAVLIRWCSSGAMSARVSVSSLISLVKCFTHLFGRSGNSSGVGTVLMAFIPDGLIQR